MQLADARGQILIALPRGLIFEVLAEIAHLASDLNRFLVRRNLHLEKMFELRAFLRQRIRGGVDDLRLRLAK